MTQLAVKDYVATKARDIDLRGTGWTRLEVQRQRMMDSESFGECPTLIVGRVKRVEDRMGGPRGLGQKEDVWRVNVLLYVKHSHDDEIRGQDRFDVLVEAACDLYRRLDITALPVLTDPLTSETSYLSYIGEHIESETLDPVTTAQSGLIALHAVVTLEVREVLTA